MKENKKIIKSNLKTLLKRYSQSDAITNLERNYTQDSIHKINPNIIQTPRFLKKLEFSKEEIDTFANDVSKGIYQPIIVRIVDKNTYEVVVGLRQLLGARELEFTAVNCLINSFSDEETLLVIASFLREQKASDIVEEAYICSSLKNDFKYKNKDLEILFRQSPSQISNILQLLNLDQRILHLLMIHKITYGHAKAFSRLSKENVDIVVDEILNKNLSVRETERLVKSIANNKEINNNLLVTKNKITLVFANQKNLDDALSRINKLIKRRKIKL